MQNKNPTFNDAVNIFSDGEILGRLFELYPDEVKSKEGYQKVLKELRTLKPKGTGMKILVESVYDDLDKRSYTSISGVKNTTKVSYAIEYTPWAEWLGMKVDQTALNNYNYLDIVAHCLWEMTWSGFDQKDIANQIKDFAKKVKQIKKNEAKVKTDTFTPTNISL